MKFSRNLLFLIVLAAGALFAALRWHAETQFPTLRGETGMPAWDWILWEETDKGLVATRAYRVAMNTPGSGIQPGDLLKKVEYRTVPDAQLLKEIHFASGPGKILIYQVERQESNSFNPRNINLFISLSWKPFFTPASLPLAWNIQLVISLLFGFFTLIILLILYPLVRTSLKKNFPLLLLLPISFIQFAWMAFRTLRIRLDFPSSLVFQEKIFILGWCMLACAVILPALWALPGKNKWIRILPGTLILAWMLTILPDSIFQCQDYREHTATLTSFLAFYLSVSTLWFVSLERDSGPIKDLAWFRWASGIGLSGMAILSLLSLIDRPLTSQDTLLLETLIPVALFLPVLDLSASRLKFGKATVVLTRTIQYILFSGAVVLAWLLLGWLLDILYAGAPYLELIKLLAVIIAALIARAVYHRNKRRFSRMGISLQPRQAEEIQQFLAAIPRYTHSQDLLKDAATNIEKYFGAREVSFYLEDQEGISPEMRDTYNTIFQALTLPELFWSANKELSPLTLNEAIEEYLTSQQIALVIPLRFSRAKAGLLLLGKKNKGVYNLEDLDMLRRLSTQIWLTLDILHLLENEKLLMQKTMEANLTALRSQINPHFLFNTLNTIASLIHDSPEMAEMAVENLAYIFRYTLRTSGENFATVENEMGLVSKYMEIEKFRFGDNLEVIIEIQDSCRDLELPALVIQTIVENCIKHGIQKIVTKGIVSIRVFEAGEYLKAVIEDNGPGIRSDRILKGTGLNNIHSRLHSLYDNPDILIFENTGQGTRVTLTLPKKRHEK